MPDDVVELRKALDRRLSSMEGHRLPWLEHWREIGSVTLPRLGRWLAITNDQSRGLPKSQAIIDPTASVSAARFASGLMAGVTSPARPWFALTVPDQTVADGTNVKLWLDEVSKRITRVFAESNFYRSIATLYQEIAVFGTGVMLLTEDYDDVVRCYPLTAGEYFLSLDHRLEVSTLYRRFVMTVDQITGQFGLDACSSTVQSLYHSGQMDSEVVVAHAIEPNDGRIEGAPGPQGMAWREIYWEWGLSQTALLQVKGYHERPFIAARWEVTSNDAYGSSPAMTALGDIRSLQLLQLRKAQVTDKLANPPMVAPASMKGEPATLIPGGVTYVPQGATNIEFRPAYEVNPAALAAMEAAVKEVQDRIKSIFFVDLFLMIDQLDTVRTATEITERKTEKMMMLGPALERLHDELLSPAVQRTFSIMLRGGLLPPLPPELRGHYVGVEFISTMAQAQKAVSTTSIERMVAFIGNLAGARPDALDKLNVDETIDEYADALGVAPKILNDDKMVAAIRQKRVHQQLQQQAVQTSMAAAQGAQTLSQTDVGGGQNALQMILGREG